MDGNGLCRGESSKTPIQHGDLEIQAGVVESVEASLMIGTTWRALLSRMSDCLAALVGFSWFSIIHPLTGTGNFTNGTSGTNLIEGHAEAHWQWQLSPRVPTSYRVHAFLWCLVSANAEQGTGQSGGGVSL